MSNYPKVILTEEGMRDGLQIERAGIPVADKIRLLDALSETGLKDIAVGSFVSPRRRWLTSTGWCEGFILSRVSATRRRR
jgi:isopropylmalate/homocitrate/citramalate synthase